MLGVLAGKLAPGGVLSIFPMHVGVERLMDMIAEERGLELRDRIGLVLKVCRR